MEARSTSRINKCLSDHKKIVYPLGGGFIAGAIALAAEALDSYINKKSFEEFIARPWFIAIPVASVLLGALIGFAMAKERNTQLFPQDALGEKDVFKIFNSQSPPLSPTSSGHQQIPLDELSSSQSDSTLHLIPTH